jgi:hypothetical protein
MNPKSIWTNRYDKEHCRGIYLKLNLRTDADVLEKLDSVPNKQGYIKELIRRDIYENHHSGRGTGEYGKGTEGNR